MCTIIKYIRKLILIAVNDDDRHEAFWNVNKKIILFADIYCEPLTLPCPLYVSMGFRNWMKPTCYKPHLEYLLISGSELQQ